MSEQKKKKRPNFPELEYSVLVEGVQSRKEVICHLPLSTKRKKERNNSIFRHSALLTFFRHREMVSWLNPYMDQEHFESSQNQKNLSESERHKLGFQLEQLASDAWAFSKFTLKSEKNK